MTSDIDQIAAIKSNTLAQMVAVSTERKPSYTENGQSFSWTQYLDHLEKRVEWCNQMLAAAQPFEIETRGIVP
jgi:hypothetical protein